MSEPATRDAQFEAKAIWLSRADMGAETLLRLKKEHPELVMRQQVKAAAPGSYPLLFGKRFQKDVRLRRAVSMLFDRDTFLDAAPAYNADVYRKVGLDVTTFWDGHLTLERHRLAGPQGQGPRQLGPVVPVQPDRGEEADVGRGLHRRQRRLRLPRQLRAAGRAGHRQRHDRRRRLQGDEQAGAGERLAQHEEQRRRQLRRLPLEHRQLLQRRRLPRRPSTRRPARTASRRATSPTSPRRSPRSRSSATPSAAPS